MGPDGTPSSDRMVKYIILIRNTILLNEKSSYNQNPCWDYFSVWTYAGANALRNEKLQHTGQMSFCPVILKLCRDMDEDCDQTAQTRSI